MPGESQPLILNFITGGFPSSNPKSGDVPRGQSSPLHRPMNKKLVLSQTTVKTTPKQDSAPKGDRPAAKKSSSSASKQRAVEEDDDVEEEGTSIEGRQV
jgi:hypothetical protein